MEPHTSEPGRSTVDAPADAEKGAQSSAAQVLQQLATALEAFNGFKDREQTRLDPWVADSLAVTEQSLMRACLAFSQLHADLAQRGRRAAQGH